MLHSGSAVDGTTSSTSAHGVVDRKTLSAGHDAKEQRGNILCIDDFGQLRELVQSSLEEVEGLH